MCSMRMSREPCVPMEMSSSPLHAGNSCHHYVCDPFDLMMGLAARNQTLHMSGDVRRYHWLDIYYSCQFG